MLVKHREALYQGDKDSIFDILTWLFSQQQQQPGLLHKRAFVGYYLGGINVSLISTPSRTLCTAFRAAALLADISQLHQQSTTPDAHHQQPSAKNTLHNHLPLGTNS